MKKIPHICFFVLLLGLGFYGVYNPLSSNVEIKTQENTIEWKLVEPEVSANIEKQPAEPQESVGNLPIHESVQASTPTTAKAAAAPAPKRVAAKTPPPPPSRSSIPVAIASVITCDTGTFNVQFLCALNQYRQSKGLNSLSYNSALNSAALDHAGWMNANSLMSHIGEDGSKFYERCAAFNTQCDAENVSKGYTNAKRLLNAWIASPSHNKNLLGNHTVIGLGLVGVYADLVMR